MMNKFQSQDALQLTGVPFLCSLLLLIVGTRHSHGLLVHLLPRSGRLLAGGLAGHLPVLRQLILLDGCLFLMCLPAEGLLFGCELLRPMGGCLAAGWLADWLAGWLSAISGCWLDALWILFGSWLAECLVSDLTGRLTG